MHNPLLELSDHLAAAVESASRFILAVTAHPRLPASGIHWQPGVIVSTAHTLKGHTSAELTLPDGSTQSAKLAAKDAATDLAVYRIDATHLPTPTFTGPDTLRPGNLALAAGRSARGGPTASLGLISSLSGPWRTWQGGLIDHHIQLDIGLYPSSNGGAVLDSQGCIIGMATGAFSRFGAIAIPTAAIQRSLETLLLTGYMPRGYLGVGLRPVPLPASLRAKLPTPAESALIVLSVEPGSAADAAGLIVGDILTAIGSTPTSLPEDVQSALGPDSVGKTVAASILRGGNLLEIQITAGERREEQ
jgi:S1-C subfamily serine protease